MADVEDERNEKKRRRFRPGTMALLKICKYKKFTGFLSRKLPFVRWVREIAHGQWGYLRFQALALLILPKAVKAYIINLFEDANLYAIHAKHVTLMPKDVQLACKIQAV